MKKTAVINPENCKACGICIDNCAKNAIEMTDHINTRGYKHIALKQENCVGCGICYLVCPDAVFTIVEKEEE